MAAKSNGKGAEQPVAALAAEPGPPVPRKRGRPPTTILGGDAPLTPAAPGPEPDPLASVGAEIDTTLAELTENQRKARQAKEEPLQVAQRPLLEALAAKEPETRRVTRHFEPLLRKLSEMRAALGRPWPAGDACQRLLRVVSGLIEQLENLLRDPVEEIRGMILSRTLDDFRPELSWPQGPRFLWNSIASLDLREGQIEGKYAELSGAFQELCSGYGSKPVLTLKRIPEVPERQTMAVTE